MRRGVSLLFFIAIVAVLIAGVGSPYAASSQALVGISSGQAATPDGDHAVVRSSHVSSVRRTQGFRSVSFAAPADTMIGSAPSAVRSLLARFAPLDRSGLFTLLRVYRL
jgi:hypothetical protein